MARPRANWIPELDLIRFGAALLVMLFHLDFLASQNASNSVTDLIGKGWGAASFAPVTQLGWIGVQIFFVLSGVVIAQSADGQAASAFIRSRFLRLYPTVWICATATLVVLIISGRSSLAGPYIRALTLFPVWTYIDGSYWTLPIELAFYGLVAIRLKVRQSGDLTGLFIRLGLMSAIYAVADCLTGPLIPARIADLTLLDHGCFFSIGGLTWVGSRGRLPRKASLALPVILAACCWQIFRTAEALGQGSEPYVAALALWAGSLAIMVCALSRKVGTGVQHRWVRLAGLTTYPLYLLHQMIGTVLIRFLQEQGLGAGLALALATLIAVFAALIVAGVLEPSLRNRVNQAAGALSLLLTRAQAMGSSRSLGHQSGRRRQRQLG